MSSQFRQSWHPRNFFNLWQRTTPTGPKIRDIKFQDFAPSLFAQRWRSKRAVRAYHGDYIPEKVFKRWYLPETLPDVRPKRISDGDDTNELKIFAKRKAEVYKDSEKKKGMAPVGSLMFQEVERRIDTIVFRSCFAESIYEARRLVIHGYVRLNGRKVDFLSL
jgi:ribosomal protein S4